MAARGGTATYRYKEGKTIVQYNRQSPLLLKLYGVKEQAQEDNIKGEQKQLASIPRGNYLRPYQTI